MESGIILTGVTPHPPLLIPAIGQEERDKVTKTHRAFERLAQAVAELAPEVIVIISPHGPVFQDGLVVNFAPKVEGDFGDFGLPEEKLEFLVDGLFAGAIQDEATELGVEVIPLNLDLIKRFRLSGKLDHGALVPLYYLQNAGWQGRIVSVTMGILPIDKLYSFGIAIQRAARNLHRRVTVVASGDLSHRLTPEAPNGFNPQGKEFDAVITRCLERADIRGLLSIPPSLREEAGECGYRPFVMMAGAADGFAVEPEFYSYEGPFGVGYAVAVWRVAKPDQSRHFLEWITEREKQAMAQIRANESPVVRLARQAAELYVAKGAIVEDYPELPPDLPRQAGVFVSVKSHGNLRGCIGTFLPTQPSLAEEVVSNAIQSVSNDPRFEPVSADELSELEYSVDILSEPREVSNLSEHNPKIHGIIVGKGHRRGLLLPDLEGVETTEQQTEIAKRKAGIMPDETGVSYSEFEVNRYK